jgi:spore germination cell wall hydrolase CwlJ-like protein
MRQAVTLLRPFDGLMRHATRLNAWAEKLWRAYPREIVGLGLLGVAVAAALGGVANSTPETASKSAIAPPAPPPMLIRQLAPDQALQVNQQIPIAQGPNPAASPFVFKGNDETRKQAMECLTSAIYYEAGNEGDDGERAVAQVVLNRVRHPAFPASVCGVVYEGSTRPTACQFTFTCDGSLYRQPDAEGWNRAYKIADAALSGFVYSPVGFATHYHANYVVPYWASTLAKNAIVGAHIFYRWAGGWGQPAAFTDKYAGHEQDARALRNAALAAVAANASLRAQGNAVSDVVKNIPGAETLKLEPSMRGDKRVAVRFNLVARKASDDATHEDYAKKFEASDNLKWALSEEAVAQNEKPLGKSEPPLGGGSVAGAQH